MTLDPLSTSHTFAKIFTFMSAVLARYLSMATKSGSLLFYLELLFFQPQLQFSIIPSLTFQQFISFLKDKYFRSVWVIFEVAFSAVLSNKACCYT
jgi:hypothetical protein